MRKALRRGDWIQKDIPPEQGLKLEAATCNQDVLVRDSEGYSTRTRIETKYSVIGQ